MNINFRVLVMLFSLMISFTFSVNSVMASSNISEALLDELSKDGLAINAQAELIKMSPGKPIIESKYNDVEFSFLLWHEDHPPKSKSEEFRFKSDSLNLSLKVPKDVDRIRYLSYTPTGNPFVSFSIDSGPCRLNIRYDLGHQFIKEIRGNWLKEKMTYFLDVTKRYSPRQMRRIDALKTAIVNTGISVKESEKYISKLGEKLKKYDDEALFKKIVLVNKKELKEKSIPEAIEIAAFLYLREMGTCPIGDVRFFYTDQKIGFKTDRMTVYYYLDRYTRDKIAKFALLAFTSDGRHCWSGFLRADTNKTKDRKEIDTFLTTVLRAN